MARQSAARRGGPPPRPGPFFFSAGIIRTIRISHIVIIGLLLIPLVLSIAALFFNTVSYNRIITNVEKTNRLNQVVRTGVAGELWDVVAGNKSFAAGDQYRIIRGIARELDDIMRTTADTESRRLLEVAGRALNTLTRYVDRLGAQMGERAAVIENERMLDEIRGVSGLVSELLQDFIVREIESAAEENRRIITRLAVIGAGEAALIFFALLFSAMVRASVARGVEASIRSLVALSSSIAEGNLDARAEVPHVREFETLTENLNIMADKIKTLVNENIREQRNLQKSEMKALQAQITPHFLYNTLDSIVWLAEGNRNEQVIAITRAFSDFFRISLNRGSEWLRVEDEFKHIENYLVIQKIRYRDILDYSIEYERDMNEKIMLKLLLQPLVENALYHGIKNKRGKGAITVRGRAEGEFLAFSVEDNGIGMTEERLAAVRARIANPPAASVETEPGAQAARSYGLYNVSKRVELYYNRAGVLDIASVYREGTKVTLRVPALADAVAGFSE